MAKAKLSLTLDPTFKADAPISVPGNGIVDVSFTYKYRDRDAFKEFLENLKDYENDVELLQDILAGWELDDPFGKASIEKLTVTYIGAPAAILQTYIEESTGARTKN